MITCRSAHDLLLDFLEGDAPVEVRRQVMRHLDGCPPCARFAQSYRLTPVLCRSSLRRQPPAAMGERLMAFLREQGRLRDQHA